MNNQSLTIKQFMKRKFTLTLLMFFASYVTALAIGPTVPSNNLTFPAANIDGDRFNLTFNKGNGAFRIIVVKEGSAVSTTPVNGTDYINFNAQFGTTGTAFNGTDGYVVYRGSTTLTTFTLSVTKLNPNTTYHVSIWEFNGTGAAAEYLQTPLNGQVTTKAAPTGQASITSFSAVVGNKMTVNFSAGNGERRLLIARKGAPVNATPEQLKDYAHSTAFGQGAVLNGDNYAVHKSTSTSPVTITSLEPNTIYHYAIFEYNGNNGPVYMVPGSTGSQSTTAGPTQASGTINFNSIEGNRVSMSFSPGNGKYQMIIAHKGQPVTSVPQNGQTYLASPAYGSGFTFPNGDVVVNFTGTDRTFTNLDPSSTYHFRIYDFDMDAAGNTYFLTSAYSEKSGNTAFPPTQQPSGIWFENITGSSATIKYAPGDATYRLVVMKEGSAVNATPVDLTRYNGNLNYTQAPQISPGNYVMIGQMNSNALTVTGLTPGKSYHVAIWGFNGNNYPVYGNPPGTEVLTIPNQPSAIGTGMQVGSIEGNSLRFQWSGGDGGRRLVIARKGAAVDVSPVDGTSYNVGDVLSQGQYVVYDGPNRLAQLDNLESGSTYHIAVFEYNPTSTGADYLTSASLPGTGTTLAAPVGQTTGFFASNIQDNSAMINFAAGGGSARIFLMRAGSPVTAEPQDFVNYGTSTTYGIVQLGATGNYIVQKSTNGSPFTVTSLTPNTQYFVTAFEYNGSIGPVFLRPGNSFSFTTTGNGIALPTANSTNPSFSLVDGNKLTFDWDKGDGAKRIVVIRAGSAVAFTPADGVDYTANADLSTATDQGGGQYIVFNSTQESVTVSGLLPATTYHFAVFEYNGAGTQTRYLLTGKLTAQNTTATTPATGSTGISGTASNLTIALTWNSGPGAGRLVVMKEGSAVMGTPADLSKYPHSAAFTGGSQIAAGEFVVYAGSGSSITVTGLQNNKTYHYKVFEYNGVDAPVYNTVNTTSNSTVVSSSLPLKWLSFTVKEENGVIKLDWATTQEFNTDHFVVERSQSNGVFTPLETVAAKGSDIRNDYSYVDRSQPTGIVTYRIKQVDIDNRFEYSKQVTLRALNQQTKLKLYPNPAQSFTRISLPQGLQQATVKIHNLNGALVKTISVTNGQVIELQGLSKGVYQLVVTDELVKYSERLIIQ
jgi:hypothetical protein